MTNESWIDLFRTSLKAHRDYLTKDILNKHNKLAFENAIHEILTHMTTSEEIQSFLDDDMDLFPQDRWWQTTDKFGHTTYAYEVALEIMVSMEERFNGTYRYPGLDFYMQYSKISGLFKG